MQAQRTLRKRKVKETAITPGYLYDSPEPESVRKKVKAQPRKKKVIQEKEEEKRARRFRTHAPQSFLERLERIRIQRMFVVDHQVQVQTQDDNEHHPKFYFTMVGTTGNIYNIVIGKVPTCDCPDGKKGNQCKHICYALVNCLKAPLHLQYQLAFLSTELQKIYEIYLQSPLRQLQITETEIDSSTDDSSQNFADDAIPKPAEETPKVSEDNPKAAERNRKPADGDCPVCFQEFKPEEKLVWCKACCGNNVHTVCFDQWAASTRNSGVRCIYCRANWEFDAPPVPDIKILRNAGSVNEEGYRNVASEFGLSGQRDFSVYSSFSTAHRSYSSGRRSNSYR